MDRVLYHPVLPSRNIAISRITDVFSKDNVAR